MPDDPASTRKVLLVSPQFPPSTLVGAHRARHLAKHLGAFGWRPTVITVRPEAYEDILDHRLAALVPAHVVIERVAALPKSLCRPMGIGDLGLRSYASLRAAVLRHVDGSRPQIVFITGFPFYQMLMAPALARRGVAVVLDFQDPWVSAWGARQPALSKAGLAHRLACWLEPRAVKAASGLVAVSSEQNREMQRRYPDISARRFCTLPIGGDWDDVQSIAPSVSKPAKIFLYAGALLPRSVDIFGAFFRAVAGLRADAPDLLGGVTFRFIGTAGGTNRTARQVVMPIAAREGVGDLVDEVPWRLPYLDALGEMRSCHANLLIGSDEVHYTASKIYPALMSGRPCLAIFHEKSSSHELLARCGGGIALSFGGADALAAIGPSIRSALEQMIEGADRFGAADRSIIAPYTAPEIARRCATFFDQIVAEQGEVA